MVLVYTCIQTTKQTSNGEVTFESVKKEVLKSSGKGEVAQTLSSGIKMADDGHLQKDRPVA